jgi:hypothetical protein
MIRSSAEYSAPPDQLLGLLGKGGALEVNLLEQRFACAALEHQRESIQDFDDFEPAGWLLIEIPTQRTQQALVRDLLTRLGRHSVSPLRGWSKIHAPRSAERIPLERL